MVSPGDPRQTKGDVSAIWHTTGGNTRRLFVAFLLPNRRRRIPCHGAVSINAQRIQMALASEEREDGKEETKEQSERRQRWEAVFAELRSINKGRDGKTKGQEYRTLLVPDAGGSVFIPMAALDEDYQRPAKDSTKPKLARPIVQYLPVNLEMNQIKTPRLIHADINAAVNLGLRAVADPKVWSIHSRLRSRARSSITCRSKNQKGQACEKREHCQVEEPNSAPLEEIKPDKFFAKEKRKHGSRAESKGIEIVMLSVGRAIDNSTKTADEREKRRWLERAQKKTPKASDSRHPNFFADTANFFRTHWGAAKLQVLLAGDTHPTHLVSGKALWGFVKGQEWKGRCHQFRPANRLEACLTMTIDQ